VADSRWKSPESILLFARLENDVLVSGSKLLGCSNSGLGQGAGGGGRGAGDWIGLRDVNELIRMHVQEMTTVRKSTKSFRASSV
jgi:hypothetical protein